MAQFPWTFLLFHFFWSYLTQTHSYLTQTTLHVCLLAKILFKSSCFFFFYIQIFHPYKLTAFTFSTLQLQETRAFLSNVWLACPGPRTLKVQDTKSGGLWEAGGGTWLCSLKCLWTFTWRLVSLLGYTRIDHSFGLCFFFLGYKGGKLIHKHGKINQLCKWLTELKLICKTDSSC